MTNILNRKVYYADDVIFREGDIGDRAFLIESGKVRILKRTPTGVAELGQLGPGAIFGEMAMIDSEPRMASAIAIVQTVVTYVDHKTFERKMEEADPFVHALLRMLVKNVRSVTERIREDASGTDFGAL